MNTEAAHPRAAGPAPETEAASGAGGQGGDGAGPRDASGPGAQGNGLGDDQVGQGDQGEQEDGPASGPAGTPGDGEAAADTTDGTADDMADTVGSGDDDAAPADGAPPASTTGASGDEADEAAGGAGAAGADGEKAAEVTEAEAELAAQREVRERIERRKAEKAGPVDSGAKLSGTAAELLAAVRAVESGEKPAKTFGEPAAAPRRPAAPAVAPAPRPAVAPGPSAPAPPPATVGEIGTVLAAGGAPESLAGAVASALGEDAAERLRDDPWQLLRVPGVRPEQADSFARACLGPDCGPADERRGRAITVWLLDQAALAGHTALDAPALSAALEQRSVPVPDSAVQSAIAEGEVLVFQDALDIPGAAPGETPRPAAEAGPVEGTTGGPAGEGTEGGDGTDAGEGEPERPVRVLIGLERFALAEESLADGLARLVNSPVDGGDAPTEPEPAPGAARGAAAELIRACATHALVAHTGGEAARAEAAALVTAALARGRRVIAATHTADGRDRFAALLAAADTPGDAPADTPGTPGSGPDARTAGVAVTVAGLLSGAEGPGRDGEGALVTDLLVVLDAPQLDVESAAMLVESLPDGARLVLSGDPAVLWSAGPGRVFADLLAARVCPQIASRTPDPGPIGELISGIAFGELTQVEAPGKEVMIVPVRDPGEAVHRTVQLVADSIPRALGVPAGHTQVITPGHGGAVGTRALNTALKERLNPGPGRFGGFDPGDRVVWSPVPGRAVPASVVGADAEGLRLECDGSPVVVARERVEQSVRHGWAMTVHQAVGQRWPAAVVVLPGDAAHALSRAWVYTAFGRGERHLSVVHGVEQALPRAVAEGAPKPRTTRLADLLRGQVPAAE
ncbi:helix-hairpin-helix domain-containing protein [Streptomyces uncialis]|uniref:helix-hairpin-helix domain-containing protein n=1 Tax=Streptomyces uncialis TaxID=1048205 RepID=UPI0033F2BF87